MNDSMSSSSENSSSNSFEEVFTTPATGLRGVTLAPGLYNVLLNVCLYLSILIGLPGIAANILIIITYTKMGINNSINASYTAMAVSDLGCVVTTIWMEILLLPQLATWEYLPFIPMEILSPLAAFPNMGFAKTTAFITAYISLERCLCVAFPHKVKMLFTKRLTVTVLIIIAVLNVVPPALTGVTHTLVMKESRLYPNRTVVGISRNRSPFGTSVSIFQYWLYGIAYQWVPIGVTVICSIFLAVHLRAGVKWRSKSLQQPNSENTFSKEDRIVKTVLMISVLSIILSTPVSVNFILVLLAPQLSPFTFENGVGTVLGSFATSMTMLNSCFNLMIYYKLGTKFRETLKKVLNRHEGSRLEPQKAGDRGETTKEKFKK